MGNDSVKVSVIIIVYNQYNSLLKVMRGFSEQTMKMEDFEIIIVDDGSTDETANLNLFAGKYDKLQKVKIYHTPNNGRAHARNVGISKAKGKFVIFCDGDRVPSPNYIEEHYKMHCEGNDIVVGASYDYFGKNELMDASTIDWNEIHKKSRLPSYYRNITKLYDNNGKTSSELAYLSLLIGNSSINKCNLIQVGGFDERFREWGFEHFDLGLRLYRAGCNFSVNHNAKSYHIPHPRETNFYQRMITKNIDFFSSIHKDVDCNIIYQLLIENKSIEEINSK
jgi:glycosyltransferase involved in cell wall biosynthesis